MHPRRHVTRARSGWITAVTLGRLLSGGSPSPAHRNANHTDGVRASHPASLKAAVGRKTRSETPPSRPGAACAYQSLQPEHNPISQADATKERSNEHCGHHCHEAAAVSHFLAGVILALLLCRKGSATASPAPTRAICDTNPAQPVTQAAAATRGSHRGLVMPRWPT